jgi:hypothetical protein
MIQPTEDEIILVIAKELAHEDSRPWDTEDVEEVSWEHNRVIDDVLRAEYLNRAREILREERI